MRTLRLVGLVSGGLLSIGACAESSRPDSVPADPSADAAVADGGDPRSPDGGAASGDAGADASASGDLGPAGAFRAYAENGAAGLRDLYDLGSGLYPGIGWWNSANAVTAMIQYSARTGSTTYNGDIAVTFDKNSGKNFLNEYYDDEGWWALAWIDAYDLTKEVRYLEMAKKIFVDMVGGWDETCGGGIWWKKDRKYKNAIANELFFEVAVRLHQRTPGDTGPGSFIDWANRDWVWFDGSGMINAENLVNDGLENCKNNGQTTWTYNQGVLIGALVELSKVKGDATLVARAQAIADASFTKLVDDQGVLREPCEPGCDDDQTQFKGIFMRNLATLIDASDVADNQRFLRHNADWVWNAARKGAGNGTRVGLRWSQSLDKGEASRLSSALDLLNAAVPYDEPQQNLVLGKVATSSAACRGDEGPDRAIDGKVGSKWCGDPSAGSYWLAVDLGEGTPVGRVIVRHAGANGENAGWNTKDFTLKTSDDQKTWTDFAVVKGNTRGVTIHRLPAPVTGRYLRLDITAPQSDASTVAARITELEVYAR